MDCDKIRDLISQVSEEQKEFEKLKALKNADRILGFFVYFEKEDKRDSFKADIDQCEDNFEEIHKGIDSIIDRRLENSKEKLCELADKLKMEIDK